MRTIDGRAHAAAINAAVTSDVDRLRGQGIVPRLAVVVPTDDEATAWYVRNIGRAAGRVGVDCAVESLVGADTASITRRLAALSADPDVHGIICQVPLPAGLSLAAAGAFIDPAKDVDGANPLSLGRLAAGLDAYASATAAAVVEILRRENVPMRGARAVVIGRSIVVGKPLALLLIAADATVTVCHSRTVDLPAVAATADILVAAVGRPALVTAAYIKPGAIVVDVGTNPTPEGGLVGDVDPTGAADAAGLTPVPGGVGPVTTAMLLRATVTAAAVRSSPGD
jgi:methylenetetrahydrofolate dehydrogenase (NADP+) / methenyltetrahydrofolate cyclohydrolase